MARLQCTTALWLLAICLSVAVITADVEDGSCLQAGPGEKNEPGLCPPIKIRVPYPGFDGNYGVNAMYHHGGAKWYMSMADGHNHEAVWYEHHVPVSHSHPAFTLMLHKTEDPDSGKVSWTLERHTTPAGSEEPTITLVSELADDVEFPWQSTRWVPQIQVAEMSWDAAHQQAVTAVKAALRYAVLVKGMSGKQRTTAKLHRAATNVKTTITKVREIEEKGAERGHIFSSNGIRSSGSAALSPVDEKAAKAAAKAAANVNSAWWHNTGKVKRKFMHPLGAGSGSGSGFHHARVKKGPSLAAKAIERAEKRGKKSEEKGVKKEAASTSAREVREKAKKAIDRAQKKGKDQAKEAAKKSTATADAAKKAAADAARGALSMGGLTAEHLKNPVFKDAFKAALAKTLGVKESDIRITETHADNTTRVGNNATVAPPDYNKATGTFAAGSGDSKKGKQSKKKGNQPKLEVNAKGSAHSKEGKPEGAGSGSGQSEEGKQKGKKHESYSSASGSASHKAQHKEEHKSNSSAAVAAVETLLEAPSNLLSSGNVHITFKVHGNHSLDHLKEEVASGHFSKELKAAAHDKGLEVDPTASVVDPETGKVLQSQKPRAVNTTKPVIIPPPPANVPLAPSPPGKMPEDTRWDHKGKTGTFTRCASAAYGGHLMLMCPHGTVVSEITYADLGFPGGAWCGWNPDPMCSFPDALPLVKSACEGQPNCIIPTDLDLLAVQKPVPASHARMDLEENGNAMQMKDVDAIVHEAGSQAQYVKVSKLPAPDGRVVQSAVSDAVADVMREDPLAPGVSRHLLFQEKTAPKCWARKDGDNYVGRLVVRAECKGTMVDMGLRTSPSLALGKVTIAGLPSDSFKVAKGYHKAFQLAVAAAQCQCDVNEKTCIKDDCAGAVEIKKMGGDAADTDIEFQVRVPPTRTAADIEAVLALELHSESKLYMQKEMAKKAAVKKAEMVGYLTEEEHEAHNKHRVEVNERKEKGIYQAEEVDQEQRTKEKSKKQDSAKWTAEHSQKKFQKDAEAAQDEAAKAAEKNLKAHYLHKEARAKRRAAKEVLDKKNRAAEEVMQKSKMAKLNYNKATEGVSHTQQLANSASESYNKAHTVAQNKVKSVEQLKSQQGDIGGSTSTSAAAVSPAASQSTSSPVQISLLSDDSADAVLSEDSVVEEAVAAAMHDTLTTEFIQEDASADVTQTGGDHPTFSENFVAAAKLEGLTAPPIGSSVKFWKAQQASAEADAAQLGVPAPPPTEPGFFDGWDMDMGGMPHWADEFGFLLLILLLVLCCLCCCCQDGMRGYSPYKRSDQDYSYHEDVARQREQQIRSGMVDANGLPIMRGNGQDPIGLGGIGNQGSRALLNNIDTGGYSNNSSSAGAAPSGPSTDPRRDHQKKVVAEELESAYRELNAVPWYKRQAVQSRINELLKWQDKLNDESRQMYASAHDPTTGFPKGQVRQQQWQQSVSNYQHTLSTTQQQGPRIAGVNTQQL